VDEGVFFSNEWRIQKRGKWLSQLPISTMRHQNIEVRLPGWSIWSMYKSMKQQIRDVINIVVQNDDEGVCWLLSSE
jgi:hypothetical protein